MRRFVLSIALTFLIASPACGRRQAANRRALPLGDGVWFSEGLGVEEVGVEEVLARGGLAHVFLPACRIASETGRFSEVPPPPLPFARAPVVLVAEGGEDFERTLASGAPDGLAASIASAMQQALRRRAAFGRVEGVHLDLAFSRATAEAFGKLTGSLRAQIPSDLFVTCSLRFSPGEKEREDLERQLAAVDGFVAFLFGERDVADPISTDALGKSWWAGYVASARGEWRDASGNLRGAPTEKILRPLTDDPRVPLEHDLALRQEGISGFLFRPAASIEVGGVRVGAGDQITFRQPVVSDLLYRMGSDLAGRRGVRGRVVVLDGISDSERIFTLPALSDVLLGRPLLPDLRVSLGTTPSGIHLSAENLSSHASVISRTANWVEVDVPSGHIRDVQIGGFDRFEVFDREGRPVTPGRATRVRFYETLVAPLERIEDAAILIEGRPSKGCCRFRQHLLSASGTELSGDWVSPGGSPTPAPQ